jgi:hypothetical protein
MIGRAIKNPANDGFLPANHEMAAMIDADMNILRIKKEISIYQY